MRRNSTDNQYKRTIWLCAIRVAANLVMLAAVCVAMYQSYLNPASSLSVFCQYFFGITIVTWTAARFACSRVRMMYADADEGLVRLPGHKKYSLVHWKVAESSLCVQRPTQIAL